MELDSQEDDAFGVYIRVSVCSILLSILCFLLGACVVQLFHHLDCFMRLSTSAKSWAIGAIRGAEADKIAFEAEKRALEAKHKVLGASRVWAKAVIEVKHLGRILKEVEGRIASEHTQAFII